MYIHIICMYMYVYIYIYSMIIIIIIIIIWLLLILIITYGLTQNKIPPCQLLSTFTSHGLADCLGGTARRDNTNIQYQMFAQANRGRRTDRPTTSRGLVSDNTTVNHSLIITGREFGMYVSMY